MISIPFVTVSTEHFHVFKRCGQRLQKILISFRDEKTSPLVQFKPYRVNCQEIKEDSAEEDVVDVEGNVDVVKLHLLEELWRVAEVTVELGTDERRAVETVE